MAMALISQKQKVENGKQKSASPKAESGKWKTEIMVGLIQKQKAESRKQSVQKHKLGNQKVEIHFCFLLSTVCFSLVRLIMVVNMAINSEDSCSKSWVSFGSIAHSSRSSSSQSSLSSASWRAPPSLDTNSSCDRARDASRTWAATDVPERRSCFPNTRTTSSVLGSLTKNRIVPAANRLVRSRNSSDKRPFIPGFPISAFYFLLSAFCFPLYRQSGF